MPTRSRCPSSARWMLLPLHPSVTFFVGENGTGRSTLPEAIAVASGFNAEGGSKNFGFSTHTSHSELHRYIRISRGVKKPELVGFSGPKPSSTWPPRWTDATKGRPSTRQSGRTTVVPPCTSSPTASPSFRSYTMGSPHWPLPAGRTRGGAVSEPAARCTGAHSRPRKGRRPVRHRHTFPDPHGLSSCADPCLRRPRDRPGRVHGHRTFSNDFGTSYRTLHPGSKQSLMSDAL